MKTITLKTIWIAALLISSAHFSKAQEGFGNTLNLGIGIGGYSGYYGYWDHSVPAIHINYEFDAARNFTIAPFLTFYRYEHCHYWKGNPNYPSGYYCYHETVIPIGAKGTYYFDELLKAGSKWDFYLAGSLGFSIVDSGWDAGYDGHDHHYHGTSRVFLDIHAGAEYHFNNRIGMFLDLSNGVSTVGIAIH